MIIEIAGHKFDAKFEDDASPRSCTAFRAALPFVGEVVHVRWSGEGMWIPLGDHDFGATALEPPLEQKEVIGYEDATSYPTPGQILLYSSDGHLGKSETEILIAYGSVQFASKAGTLAGNHFATIISDIDKLKEIGISTLWQGRKPIRFSE